MFFLNGGGVGQGRNCTELFVSYHSLAPGKPEALLAKYFTGEEARPGDADFVGLFDWSATPFYDALVREVRSYFARTGVSHKAPLSKWLMLAALTVACVGVYALFVQGWWLSLLVLPWLYWMGPAAMLHDGTHAALSSSATVNRLAAKLGTLHMNPFSWYHQHVMAHHSYTNVRGRDADIASFDGPSVVYGHRSSPFTPYLAAYRHWLRSLFITVPFSCLQPSLKQDWNVWAQGWYDDVLPVTRPPTAVQRVAHFAVRWGLFAGLVFGLPWLLFAPLKALLFSVVPSGLYGCIYYLFSQVSHVNEDCFVDAAPGVEWAVWQVRHSLDYACDSSLWRVLSIALNLQTVHHLFPQVDPTHYAALRPILERVCAQFGVKHNTVPGITEAARLHFTHIWAINSDSQAQFNSAAASPKNKLE